LTTQAFKESSSLAGPVGIYEKSEHAVICKMHRHNKELRTCLAFLKKCLECVLHEAGPDYFAPLLDHEVVSWADSIYPLVCLIERDNRSEDWGKDGASMKARRKEHLLPLKRVISSQDEND